MLSTCSRLVVNKLSLTMRTHPDNDLLLHRGRGTRGGGGLGHGAPHFYENKKTCAFFIVCVPFLILNSQ